jgi:nucleotidyltransferase/DNA polymerase involved in DNA repair
MAEQRRLRDLRGVGPSIAADLQKLGISSVGALAERDGDELYDRLCALTGVRQDPCVRDTFVCAVAQARDPKLPVEQCNWWYYSAQRKRSAAKAR